MPNTTVRSFEDALDALTTLVAQMGGFVESQVLGAIDAIAKRDQDIGEQTILTDRRVDDLQRQVDERAVQLLSVRAPLASDLREALSAIKIAADLERIGDLAKNIARRSATLTADLPHKLTLQGLGRMGRLTALQLKTVLDAYARRDATSAIQVWRKDEEIDELYNSMFRELLTYMMEDPRKISASTHLLFIAKNFERVGDHATNIAETVHYLVHGFGIVEERPKSDITSVTRFPFPQKP